VLRPWRRCSARRSIRPRSPGDRPRVERQRVAAKLLASESGRLLHVRSADLMTSSNRGPWPRSAMLASGRHEVRIRSSVAIRMTLGDVVGGLAMFDVVPLAQTRVVAALARADAWACSSSIARFARTSLRSCCGSFRRRPGTDRSGSCRSARPAWRPERREGRSHRIGRPSRLELVRLGRRFGRLEISSAASTMAFPSCLGSRPVAMLAAPPAFLTWTMARTGPVGSVRRSGNCGCRARSGRRSSGIGTSR